MKKALPLLSCFLFVISCATQTQTKYQPPANIRPSEDFIIIDMPQSVLFEKLITVLKSKAEDENTVIGDKKIGE